jgi:exosortase/archaeosortase family protein
MKSIADRYPDLPVALVLLAATAVVFWPASWWIAQQTVAHEQLRQSFFLLVFAAVILWMDHRHSLQPRIEVSRRSLVLMAGAFLLMGAGVLFPVPYFPLAALALALAASMHLLFGDRGLKLTLPWIAGFAAFLIFVFLFHRFDWPLRHMAGSHAAYLLTLLGHDVHLGAVTQPNAMLLLAVDDRLFHVAAECNGFGLISTSAVLAVLLVASRPLPIFWKVLAVVLAFAVGFIFNLLRILGIVTLAPYLPNHYDLMHEVIGLAALFAGLAFLWWLIRGEKKIEPLSNA